MKISKIVAFYVANNRIVMGEKEEDPIIISESLSKKLSDSMTDEVTIDSSDKRFLLNNYSDLNDDTTSTDTVEAPISPVLHMDPKTIEGLLENVDTITDEDQRKDAFVHILDEVIKAVDKYVTYNEIKNLECDEYKRMWMQYITGRRNAAPVTPEPAVSVPSDVVIDNPFAQNNKPAINDEFISYLEYIGKDLFNNKLPIDKELASQIIGLLSGDYIWDITNAIKCERLLTVNPMLYVYALSLTNPKQIPDFIKFIYDYDEENLETLSDYIAANRTLPVGDDEK